jgi:hypothetical protein
MCFLLSVLWWVLAVCFANAEKGREGNAIIAKR